MIDANPAVTIPPFEGWLPWEKKLLYETVTQYEGSAWGWVYLDGGQLTIFKGSILYITLFSPGARGYWSLPVYFLLSL